MSDRSLRTKTEENPAIYGVEETALTTEDDEALVAEEDEEGAIEELSEDILEGDSEDGGEAEDSGGAGGGGAGTTMVGLEILRSGEPREGIHFHSGLLKCALEPKFRIWESARAKSLRITRRSGVRRPLPIRSGKRW